MVPVAEETAVVTVTGVPTRTGPESVTLPIVGAVGLLQFDVMQYRLEHEYGAPCRFERLTYGNPRWVTGTKDDVETVLNARGHMRLYDTKGNPLVLFENAWTLRSALQRETGVVFHKVAP